MPLAAPSSRASNNLRQVAAPIRITPFSSEIVLTLIDRQKSAEVLEAITNEVKLNKPGKGIAFVLEVEKVVGINHPLNRMVRGMLTEQQQ